MTLLRRFIWWLRRRRKEDELSEELHFHLAQETEDRRAAGMTDYLTKPLDRTKLMACLERHLGKIGEDANGAALDPTISVEALQIAPAPVDWKEFLNKTRSCPKNWI